MLNTEDTIELQNGCACCSLADELLTSVEQLTQGGKRDLDAIVVELSGVADPVQIKKNWERAEAIKHPAAKHAKMDKVVTLVDSSTFGTDWMTWDAVDDREGWTDGETCAVKQVPELLAEQVEAADVLVINKIDLAGETQAATATTLAKSMNEKAKVFEAEFGVISVREVLQAAEVVNVPVKERKCDDPECTDESHSHSHSHDHDDASSSDPACTDESHSHSHSHDHDDASSSDTVCTDESHSHSHSHDHDDASSSDPACTDESHSHSHSHDHDDVSGSDTVCTDPSHSHSHSHDHDSAVCTDADGTDESHSHSHDHQSTAASNLGITNFVYKSERPFSPTRLLTILNQWPVPIKEELDLGQLAEAAEEGYNVDGEEEEEISPFVGVLRSKGFCWMAPTKWTGTNNDVWRHNTVMYWSHAGKHFGISTAGKWWGTITKDKMKAYFQTNEKEFERIINEDFVSEEFGDRRQEIVFIGANISEKEITEALDACLCTDEEMDTYRRELSIFEGTTII